MQHSWETRCVLFPLQNKERQNLLAMFREHVYKNCIVRKHRRLPYPDGFTGTKGQGIRGQLPSHGSQI